MITGLSYQDKIIGLRFKTPSGVFDADRLGLRKHGVFDVDAPDIEKINFYGDLLMTEEEYQNNLQVEDVSDSPKLAELIDSVRNNEDYSYLFYITKPYEQSQEDFLGSGWTTERVVRNDEYNGQHYLYLPDGSRYRGGWVGKGRNEEVVLKNFHYEMCYWQLHAGGVVADEALKTYKDLKKYNDIILDIKQKIKERTVKNGRYTDIILSLPSAEGTMIEFVYSEYANLPRWSQRELAYKVDLSKLDLDATNETFQNDKHYHGRFIEELVIIAIMRRYREFYGKPYVHNHFR